MPTRRTTLAATVALGVFAVGWGADPPAPDPSATPAPELHRGATYAGSAEFTKLGSAVVVYPAGREGEAIAKASAIARGRWLEAAFHMHVEVVGDDRITEAQERGNLLILGWDNRVWDTPGLARPFTHGPDGLELAGIKESDPDADLLVFHRNPLEWSSFLLFWSRIDPERDRFQPVPRVGSDWAVYRDFFPVRQGMFKPARVWPPERDVTAEAARSFVAPAAPGAIGVAESEHYRAVFDKTKIDDAEAQAILRAREAALQKAAAALAPLPQGFRIQLYVYEDEDTKRARSGVGDPAHSAPWDREIHMIRRYAHSTSPHEETHVLARALYGPCYGTALYEGLAIAVEGNWHGRDLVTQTAMLRAGGALPGLATLLDEEKFRALPDDMAFGAAGILVVWLRATYGGGGFHNAFGLREATPAALARALGTSEPELTASWEKWADVQVEAHKRDLDYMAAEADAKKALKIGDWTGMAEALRRALAARPSDPQSAFNLASAQMRAADLKGAEATLKTLLATLKPEDLRFRVYGRYQLGRVYDLAGRRADALREYDAVLALPDDHGSHALALERKASPATMEQLE